MIETVVSRVPVSRRQEYCIPSQITDTDWLQAYLVNRHFLPYIGDLKHKTLGNQRKHILKAGVNHDSGKLFPFKTDPFITLRKCSCSSMKLVHLYQFHSRLYCYTMAWSSDNSSLSLHLMKNTVRIGASEVQYEKERILGRGSTRVIRELKHWRRRRHGRRLAKNGLKFYSRISWVTKPVQSANLSKNLLKVNM